MVRYGFILVLAVFLVGCNNEVIVKEKPLPDEESVSEEVNYGEQMPLEKALAAISFDPKQLSEGNVPFTVKKETAILNKTGKPSEIIELGYGGHGHSITLFVENSEDLNKGIASDWDASMEYEEITLENGETALYAENEHSHHVLWVEDGLSYFMTLSYKSRVSPKPERFSKSEVIELVDNLE